MELRGHDANPKAPRTYRGAFALSPAETARLFTGSTKPFAQVLADAAAGRPNTFAVPISIRLRIAGRDRDLTSPNVVGVLRGSDPVLRNEYVVYSAHLDHLGIGAPVKGDRIYNGTGDDASGCAALIVLAGAFASMPRPPARSILFLATTGEEKHLLGSEYFARAPTVPKHALVADLNMDVVAMHYPFTDMIARGAEQSSLGALVRRDLARLGLTLARDPSPEQMLFMRSDQYSFAKQGIPSLYVSEGDHASHPAFDARKFWMRWDRDRYHEPSDDMSQPMDLAATVEYLRPMLLIGWDIAESHQRPEWNRQDFLGRTFSDVAADAAPITRSSR